MAKAPKHSRGNGSTRRRRYAISTILMVGFGGLMFLGVAGVFAITMWSARENTLNLLADKIELTNSVLANNLRQHLDPARNGSTYIARLVSRGELDPNDQPGLAEKFSGAMAATPQILGMAYISPDMEVVRVRRGADGLVIQIAREDGRAELRRAIENARRGTGVSWGRLIWNAEINAAMIDLRTPLRRNGEYLGLLVSVVSMSKYSRLITGRDDGDTPLTRFVLYGKDYVLAHAALSKGNFKRSAGQPLPRLDQIGDPVIARLWNAKFRRELTVNLTGKTRGHVIEYRGGLYPIFYRPVTGYGKTPIIVGGYVRPGSSQVAELQRLTYASIAAGIILLLVVAMALVLGRQIGRPVRELATAARRIGELDFSHEISFRNSRLREFVDAAGAFNSMMAGLRWFETYVPRTLARRIIRDGGDAGIESGEHDVTVMFTDIVRFTGLAENLSAAQTAELLNQHFSLLAGCIEAEEGTLDKFIGDSVMAFWAPPVNPGDHVVRACRAALAIREVVARDNRARAERGEEPIRVRIGIHTGRAIVGNIGAPGRINYTVVGDTVNIAQRLEELGKTTWGAGEDAIILVSGDIAAALGDDFDLTARGSQEIRGREGRLRVFRLEAGKVTEMAQGQEPKSEPDQPVKSPEPPKPPEPAEQPERLAPRERDQTTRAYNPTIVPPAPHASIMMGTKPAVETAPPPTENPANSRPPIAPRIAPPESPAPNRRAAKDPVGYKFDWELDAIKAALRKDKDRPDGSKS